MRARKTFAVRFAALTICFPTLAQADTFWTGGTSAPQEWNTPIHWNNGIPNSGVDAHIDNGGTAGFSYVQQSGARSLFLGTMAGNSGYVLLNNPTSLTMDGTSYVGEKGTGVITQSNGTLNSPTLVVGNATTGAGTIYLSGGSLSVSVEYLGYAGNGTLNQSGGSHVAGSNLYLGLSSGADGT